MEAELLGVDRANAADHSRGQVFLDALGRRGRRGFEEPGFELLTVGAVVDPVAGGRDPLAGRDRSWARLSRRCATPLVLAPA